MTRRRTTTSKLYWNPRSNRQDSIGCSLTLHLASCCFSTTSSIDIWMNLKKWGKVCCFDFHSMFTFHDKPIASPLLLPESWSLCVLCPSLTLDVKQYHTERGNYSSGSWCKLFSWQEDLLPTSGFLSLLWSVCLLLSLESSLFLSKSLRFRLELLQSFFNCILLAFTKSWKIDPRSLLRFLNCVLTEDCLLLRSFLLILFVFRSRGNWNEERLQMEESVESSSSSIFFVFSVCFVSASLSLCLLWKRTSWYT